MEEKKLYDKKFVHIDKVGLELEGGWENPPSFQIAGDSSVHCNGNELGEARTVPQDNLKDVFNEINTKYPDDIDASCGMHIHISIKNGMLFQVADKKFRDYFIYRMGLLAKYLRHSGNETDYKRFIARFNNSNTYCKREFAPREQLRGGNSRRTMLNFCAYRKYKTVECRLLPMFENLSNARMAAYEVVDTFESYLEKESVNYEPVEVDIEVNNSFFVPDNVSMEVICA